MDSFKSLFNHVLASKKYLSLGMFAILLIALPVAVILLQQQQDKRQQAAENTTVVLNPISDTFVDANSPTTSNDASLLIKVDSDDEEKIAYLKFNLTSLTGKTITDAKLRLMITSGSNGMQFLKDVDDNSWLETITYATKPALSSEFATIKGTTSNTFKTINVTSKINTKKGQLFSFAIDTLHRDTLSFKSREATRDKPRLEVTYTSVSTPKPTPSVTIFTTPPVGTSCPAVATDTILMFDVSQSMSGQASSSDRTTKFTAAKAAAQTFINTFPASSPTNIGMQTFSSTENTWSAPVTRQLSNDYTGLKSTVANLQIDTTAGTCMDCGLIKAAEELTAHGRPGVKKVFVYLTDGRATSTKDIPFKERPGGTKSETAALAAAKAAFDKHNVTIYVIGLGLNVNTEFLQKLASLSGGKYYFPGSSENLNSIYQEIAILLSHGSVQGIVYNDTNKNGILESSEQKLPNWTVVVKTPSGATVSSGITDSTGTYTISNLCNSSYNLTQTLQSGWKQTQPASNAGYIISIVNGASLDDKNFGNTKASRCSDEVDNDTNGYADINDSSCHTDGNPKKPSTYDANKDGENGGGNTCADSKDNNNNNLIDGADPICHTDGSADNRETYDPALPESGPIGDNIVLNLNVFLHGIGSSGDNRNPASDMSNKNPLHPVRKSIVEVFNNTNILVASSEATITYASSSGSFLGTTSLPISSGNYTIKIKTEQHLRNQYSGILAFSLGETKDLPPISLVTGDVNNDNKLDILDYNTLYGCYTSDLFPTPRKCTAGKSVKADIDDQGSVNLFDLNLFIRELSVQSGL